MGQRLLVLLLLLAAAAAAAEAKSAAGRRAKRSGGGGKGKEDLNSLRPETPKSGIEGRSRFKKKKSQRNRCSRWSFLANPNNIFRSKISKFRFEQTAPLKKVAAAKTARRASRRRRRRMVL